MAEIEQLVTASPLNARNSHHVRLFRQDANQVLLDEIGLILCDNKAEENFKAIDLIHTPQESLKTSSGATEHSDFEPPYSSLELDDWSMGRGYSDHSKQKSGYLDAHTMYTVKPNILFSCGLPEAAELDLGINYSKVDYRLDVTDHDEEVNLGGAENIDLEPDVIKTYGTMFETDGVYTGLKQFHMRLFAPDVTPGYPMVDLKLEIWEAIVDTEDHTPPFIGPPFDDCWKPDDANKIATLTMPEYDWDEVNSNFLNMVMWTTATPFNLTNAADQKYFVTLTPTNANGNYCNRWQAPTYNGNTLEHAPIIYRWGDEYMWMQYENTCQTRKSWKFYIDNPAILLDYRDNPNPPTGEEIFFWSDQTYGYATKFKSPTVINNVQKMVISMEYEVWTDIADMRAIVYTQKAYSGDPMWGIPDAVHATLEYTTPETAPGPPNSQIEVTFNVTSGGGVFNVAAGTTYFIAVLGAPNSISTLGWKLKEYPDNQGLDNATAALSTDDGVTWVPSWEYRSWWFDYQFKFYFSGSPTVFDHRLTSGYGGETITFDHYIELAWNPYNWIYRRALGTIFKAKADYTNCEDFHINMTPYMNDVLVHMPPLKLEIWGVKTVGSPSCKVPDLDVKIATSTMSPDNSLTITPDSLIGIQNGITKEIVFRVPNAATTPYDPLDFGLTGGVEYFVTITPIETELEYREPNYWNIEFYIGNMADPAPLVWKKFLSDAWTQYDPVDCDDNRKMWKFYITGNPEDFKAHFAEIDHCLHVGIEFLDGSAGWIYRNGEIGLGLFQEYVPSASEKKGLFKPVNSMPLIYPGADETPNAMLKITEGLGSRAFRDWARIKSMTDLGVDVAPKHFTELPITHQFNQENADETTAYSKYVIQNSLAFTKLVFNPVIDKPITGVLSAMGAFYVCFGDKLPVRRLRYLDNWTNGETTQEWVDEEYYADMLAHQVRAGNNFIWRIKTFDSLITPADALNMHDETETGKLNFDDANEAYVGNTDYMINSYAIYGDDPHLWIMKEDMPYEIVAEDIYAFRNSAMSSMADARNSRAAIQHDTYLYFSFHDGVQRWHYGGDLLNHGPDSIGPAGLPENRRGSFADFAGYGDLLIGAYDAGEYGFSSLLAWNGQGWTELYRAGQIGERILSCYVQSMDGAPVDWLWFSEGSTIYRLPINTNPLYLIDDEFFYYKFTNSAYLDSSWISLGLKDVAKYINKFKIIATKAPSLYDMPWVERDIEAFSPKYDENNKLTEGIALAWRTDVSEGFTYYMDPTDPSRKMNMLGEVNISAPVEAEAQQIQYRLEIKLAQTRYPIVVTDIVMDSIVRLPHKSEIRLQFRLRDQDKDRLGYPDPYPTVKEKYDLLEVYTSQASPVWAQIDAKFVGERQYFIDQGSLQVIDKLRDKNIETWVMTMVLKEA